MLQTLRSARIEPRRPRNIAHLIIRRDHEINVGDAEARIVAIADGARGTADNRVENVQNKRQDSRCHGKRRAPPPMSEKWTYYSVKGCQKGSARAPWRPAMSVAMSMLHQTSSIVNLFVARATSRNQSTNKPARPAGSKTRSSKQWMINRDE